MKLLLDNMLAAEHPGEKMCDVAGCSEEAVVQCRDCLPRSLLCATCDIIRHREAVLHNRSSRFSGFHQPLPPTSIVVADPSGGYQVSKQGNRGQSLYAL